MRKRSVPMLAAAMLWTSFGLVQGHANPASHLPGAMDVPGAVVMLQAYSPDGKPKIAGTVAYLRVATTGSRAKTVYVSGKIYGFPQAPVREVFAYAEKITRPLDASVLQDLLTRSDSKMPVGSWAITKAAEGNSYVLFEAPIPVSASPALVQGVVQHVANTADQMEASLTHQDNL